MCAVCCCAYSVFRVTADAMVGWEVRQAHNFLLMEGEDDVKKIKVEEEKLVTLQL